MDLSFLSYSMFLKVSFSLAWSIWCCLCLEEAPPMQYVCRNVVSAPPVLCVLQLCRGLFQGQKDISDSDVSNGHFKDCLTISQLALLIPLPCPFSCVSAHFFQKKTGRRPGHLLRCFSAANVGNLAPKRDPFHCTCASMTERGRSPSSHL